MTTIAANREMVAADSQGTREDGLIVSMREQKVKVLGPDRDIVACQGREDEITEFEEWWDQGRPVDETPDLGSDDGFAAIVLTREGKLFKVYERCTPVEVPDDFIALGSGDAVAMGAMAAGKTPEEAIEIACRLNMYTGGPISVETL